VKSKSPILWFNGKSEASVFIWIKNSGKAGYFKIFSNSSAQHFSIKDSFGRILYEDIESSEEFRFNSPGIYEVIPSIGEEFSFQIEVSEEIYPFLIPGPGLTPSHFPIPYPSLLFSDSNEIFPLWIYVPEEMEKIRIGSWLPEENINLISPSGESIPLTWKPKKSIYRVSELEVIEPGWYEFSLKPSKGNFHFTIYEGLPIFFRKPSIPFPYYQLDCRVYDEYMNIVDSRVEIFRGKQRIGLLDIPREYPRRIYTMPGLITVQVSHGIEFSSKSKTIIGKEGGKEELDFTLSRTLKREEGWICGDHHVHSYFEDGSSTLEDLVLSAKTSGLDYLFVSDEPNPILEAGLQKFNKSNDFLALPAQEIATSEFHMNALNVYETLSYSKEEATCTQINRFISKMREMAVEHPNALMLNHPSHIFPEALKQAYFRSWWIIDHFREIRLVENFDFENWFKRLNEGQRIVGLWTTDTHDVTLIPPGYKRTYVFVGEEMTEDSIINGLLSGHCFNTRYPGALLFLTVNGAMPGETAYPDNKGYVEVTVRCKSNRPIEVVEIIGNGEILLNIYGHNSNNLESKFSLYVKDKITWIIARIKVKEEKLPVDGHRWEPLMNSGYIAFTNPIWIERRN
jgi:hypothetical protein